MAQILTFFVLIELTRAFTEYFEYRIVRLHIMADSFHICA
ncbi:MAG: phosphate-starvation-inducible PsiE family protein [Archaeoglobaceae archaeon]|nr:phosphate-starvation-inducible PsiE family protein [Archaeoglobaceae archaeon]